MTLNLLASVQWDKVGIVIGIAAGLAVVFAVLILLVSKFCAVKTDEKVSAISEQLAGANCGGCGYAGCEGFAKALAEGKADITACGPTPNENKAKIAEILGVEFAASEPVYAVVACAGGERAKNKYNYVGNDGCLAEGMYLGGRKKCSYGCMGEGTCADVCPYGAVHVKDGVSLVDKALCEACGLCVKNCPKNHFAHSQKRKGLRGMFHALPRQGHHERLRGRLYRLRAVRQKLSRTGHYDGEQSARHRLFQMYGLYDLRGKMPQKDH